MGDQRCSKCGRKVAGHKELGSVHGPNCTLPPLTPVTPATSSLPVTTNSPAIPSTSPNSTVSEPINTISGATPATNISTGVTVNNTLVEAKLVQSCGDLRAQIALVEAELNDSQSDTIAKLYSQASQLQDRLQALNMYKSQRLRALDPIQSIQAAMFACQPPPSATTTVTWSRPAMTPIPSVNLSVAGSQPAPAPFSSFTQPALALQNHFGSAGNLAGAAGISTTSQQLPATQLRHVQSAPDIAASLTQNGDLLTSLGIGQSATGSQQGNTARGSQIQNKNFDAVMAANSPFLSPDDIIRLNPLAKAVLNIPDEDKDERVALGKYIPELFSRKTGKIEDIRSKMSYQEFVAMYMRMVIQMLRDDPHLVPDRLSFFSKIAYKAVKFRWSDVRHCYSVAVQDIKHKRRTWADDIKDITDDELPPSTYLADKPPRAPRQAGPASSHASNAGSVPFPCNDWNNRVCNRTVCKFLHQCHICSQDHPAKYCPSRQAAPQGGPPSHA